MAINLDLTKLQNLTPEQNGEINSTRAGDTDILELHTEIQQRAELTDKIQAAEEAIAAAEREKANAAAVYQLYQQRKIETFTLKTDILKSFNNRIAAEQETDTDTDIYSLFLKTIKIISLMQSDEGFYNQIRDNMPDFKDRALYGSTRHDMKEAV